MKILAIEDDHDTANYVVKGLTQQGHVVDRAPNGRDGLFLAAGETYDVLIVDRMLPGLDGLAIVKTIRGAGVKTPILFLTAVEGIDDRVRRVGSRRRRLPRKAVRLQHPSIARECGSIPHQRVPRYARRCERHNDQNQVRTGLTGRGKGIRTLGPP